MSSHKCDIFCEAEVEVSTVQEPTVTVRNRRFQFWKLLNRNRTARVLFRGYGSGSKTAGFPAIFHGFKPPVFCGSGTVSVRKNFEPEPNHDLKIDSFGSDKFSGFRFGTVTDGYGYSFNRQFDKPWADLDGGT